MQIFIDYNSLPILLLHQKLDSTLGFAFKIAPLKTRKDPSRVIVNLAISETIPKVTQL